MATTATLRWSASGEADLVGYLVFTGQAPAALTLHADVGLTTTPTAPFHMITTFPRWAVWWFAVAAYDASGNVSATSTPVSKMIGAAFMPGVWP